MRIVVAHNFYGARATGGESVVFQQEVDLLRRFGHEVETIERENAEISEYSFAKKCSFLMTLGSSRSVYEESVKTFKRLRPEILHVHNYKYVLSPSIFQAAKACGVRTVLTLHNYRLICPGGQLRRGDRPCEECLHGNPIRSLWRPQCASKFSTRILQYAFYLKTRKPLLENVDAFIALTHFAKEKFIAGGLPEDKLCVKPNFVFDPTSRIPDQVSESDGLGAVFVGRLAPEKGVRFLIEAWRKLDYPLTVVGDGPLREWAQSNATPNVTFLGEKSHEATLDIMRRARCLVFPSVWYEGLPMTLIEACALGIPTIASDLGARREIIKDGESGLLFNSGDEKGFVSAVKTLYNDLALRNRLGDGARRVYEELYTPEKNIELLNAIYRQILR